MRKLKQLRIESDLTQEKLAQKSGVSRVTIISLENGEQKFIKSSTILKLADALKVEPQFLLCPEG